ncbi:MAG: prepilin-type N-terminal cleavage/methylation domain-containing protein [Pseudomonadota bacterium]
MRTRHSGFTLIELIIVIVILGVLSAIALPRFTRIESDARKAKLNAARGAVAAAAAIAHGAAAARQGSVQAACPVATGTLPNPPVIAATGTGNLCTENGNIDITRLYPAGTLNGIIAAAGLVPGNVLPTANSLATEGYATATAGTVLTIQVPGGSAAANCSFTYTPPTTLGAAPALSASTTLGC